ncbi:MAG: hypothetical protein Q7R81_04010 [Candidatus Peregrinibacteria bacterium]|nr:hypothetical protein [Candidatus Peregrinibacteria bacterium]
MYRRPSPIAIGILLGTGVGVITSTFLQHPEKRDNYVTLAFALVAAAVVLLVLCVILALRKPREPSLEKYFLHMVVVLLITGALTTWLFTIMD